MQYLVLERILFVVHLFELFPSHFNRRLRLSAEKHIVSMVTYMKSRRVIQVGGKLHEPVRRV